MNPTYQDPKTDKWWYTLYGRDFGPYDTQEQALESYQEHVGVLASGCPTCEE